MKSLDCSHCGSKELVERGGFLTCIYCQSRFVLEAAETPLKSTEIAISADIKALLRKCQDDPKNRSRYANLILDIDPSNDEARRYLR